MGSVPVLKPNKVASILERLGFHEVRQKGSHKQFRHPDGRGTTVPGTLIEILRKMGTNYADLKAALTIARASS